MYTNIDYKIGTEHTQKATKAGLQPTNFYSDMVGQAFADH
jgi:hypothetical protein